MSTFSLAFATGWQTLGHLKCLLSFQINGLLDIGRNMDQMTGRECCLSEEVDEEFEKEKQAQFYEEMEIEEQFVLESTFINKEETEQVTLRSHSSSFITSSKSRSGLSQDTRQLKKPKQNLCSRTDHKSGRCMIALTK